MIDFQRKILGDHVRNRALREALRRTVQPGMVVVDIGAGTGFLGFLAEKFGAKKCFLIEQSEALTLAKKLARANGIRGCHFLRAHSTELALPRCADLLISETLGNFALEEHLLENIEDGKRFLKPEGIVLPQGLRQFVAPLTNGKVLSGIDVWGKISRDLNFAPARTVALQNLYVEKVRPGDFLQGMKGARIWDAIDFRKKERSQRAGTVEWEISADTKIHAFGAWWECMLIPGIVLSTSPNAPPTHWEQIVLPLSEALTVRKGDRLRLTITSDSRWKTGLRVRWEASIFRRGRTITTISMDSHRGTVEEQ